MGALAPAVIYSSIQGLAVLALSWLTSVRGTSLVDALRSWDGWWFRAIAEGGYSGVPTYLVDSFGHRDATTPLAFFPGYPKLVGLLSTTTGMSSTTAGITVSVLSGVACAYALAAMGELVRGGSRRVGLVLVALFAASPMGIALTMVYSEALFCAFAAWALVFLLRRQWVYAGLLCACAGLVRTTGAALVAAIGLAAVVAVVSRKDSWRPWVGGLLAPLGLLGYLGFVAYRTGELNGWFALQERGWDSRFDWGVATAGWVVDRLSDGRSILDFVELLVLLGSLVLVVVAARARVAWPLVVHGAVVLVMTFASNGTMASKIRLMIPAFTLLVPVAIGLAKRRTSTVLVTCACVAVVSSWFGAYSLVLWGYAI
ncbi:hypothetical protein BJP25_01175 [Actinokineospora bangkokensis]|uniref:Glycosyltransferase RgtA/B/C/D-like domain-containing protein n=1 Tax=Actinokineospora bangkokensis TaxID=1193682 RepID=A0A1Q9LE29_9PSEU|nr:hypothetical protein BJP25_01175 [Actinokineospora bangkokensis]